MFTCVLGGTSRGYDVRLPVQVHWHGEEMFARYNYNFLVVEIPMMINKRVVVTVSLLVHKPNKFVVRN